jgi:hypothetical protein
MTGRQMVVRLGPYRLGLRSAEIREYYSERNRLGWKVMYLPFGWRAFLHRTRPSR